MTSLRFQTITNGTRKPVSALTCGLAKVLSMPGFEYDIRPEHSGHPAPEGKTGH